MEQYLNTELFKVIFSCNPIMLPLLQHIHGLIPLISLMQLVTEVYS